MKTFDEKDLITWANRHNAKVGTIGYFANFIGELKDDIEHNMIRTLVDISDDCECCFDCYSSNNSDVLSYGFFLPKDAVKENKTYRACRNVQELYELVFDCKRETKDSFCINGLIGAVIHFRQKGFDMTYYECITGIVVYNNGDIDVRIYGCNFELPVLFKNYEIEIYGE